METQLQYSVHPKEDIYFAFKIIAALGGYVLIFFAVMGMLNSPQPQSFIILTFYAAIIILYLFFRLGILIGYLKGNSVKVTSKQFPEIHEIIMRQCRQLEITNIPDVFIMQNGGLLNAFATRFFGSNYVVIYSDVMEEAFEDNKDTVEFIIGHELGHIKRMHMTKALLLFPSLIVPFLNSAYSRGCEYTCDNIGAALNPGGARSGLVLLAAGKKLWKKTNIDRFIEQEETEYGFWFWFAEKVSTHPRLTKRVGRFQAIQTRTAVINPSPQPGLVSEDDHSAYLPK